MKVPVLVLLFLITALLIYGFTSGNLFKFDRASRQRVASTKTALAATSQALFGPFPTGTGPTPITLFTRTPTAIATATATWTATSTPTIYVLPTAVPRTREPNLKPDVTPVPGSTNTAAGPVITEPPATAEPPTSAPPEEPPVEPTKDKPTQEPPPPIAETPCLNPQGHPIPCH